MAFQRNIIAGGEVLALLHAEKLEQVPAGRIPGTFASEPLCRLQESQARRGFMGVELVESAYGWSVRYDSGLQNFGLVASCRARQIDGSREAAEAAAKRWVAQDPARRYAWSR